MDLGVDRIAEAADLLVAARHSGAKLPGLPDAIRPRNIEDAYRIQDAVLSRLGEGSSGWFMACTGAAMQKIHGLPGPYFGRMLASAVFDSPARLVMKGAERWSLEIELVFRMGRDLPSRATPYGVSEVEASIGAMHPGLELVEGRYDDMTKVDGPTLVADNGTDGLLVLGPAFEDWRALDRTKIDVMLFKNGRAEVEGSGALVMGDPLNALVWLANELSRRGLGLRAGETVNTGNCLARYCYGASGDSVVAECGALGRARAELVS
ncbi:MAG: 2-keto-4-pentenoate hydratase [Alphaproteobacteria bacterium]